MFLDIGVGILLSIFISKWFNLPLTHLFVFLGIIFSLLPDADFLYHLFKRGTKDTKDHEHRDILHYPIFFIFIGLIIYNFSNPLGLLFIFGTLLHLLHDSIGIGWGIQWLWPISKNYFTFFYRYQTPHKDIFPKRLIYIHKPHEIALLSKKYGDENWIKNIYFKLHPYSLIEWAVFGIGVAALVYYK
jgi:hypothetical protein